MIFTGTYQDVVETCQSCKNEKVNVNVLPRVYHTLYISVIIKSIKVMR